MSLGDCRLAKCLLSMWKKLEGIKRGLALQSMTMIWREVTKFSVGVTQR